MLWDLSARDSPVAPSIQVENTLFRVPKEFFEGSPTFLNTLFFNNTDSDSEFSDVEVVDGDELSVKSGCSEHTTSERVYHLDGATADEFKALLHSIHPL